MVSVRIRRAVSGDEIALATLNEDVQRFHLMHAPSLFREAPREALIAWFVAFLSRPGAKVWLAEDGARAVGYVTSEIHERPATPFFMARRWCELDQIGVLPDCQRMGIGRALIQEVLASARSEGVPEVQLSTWDFNSQARAAFGRLGFSPTQTRLSRKID